MNYANVKNPKWFNAEQSLIDCEVDFVDLVEEYVPFTASPNDSTEHGRNIYQQLVNGNFGTIAPYEPPPEKTQEQKAFLIRSNRDAMLKELDVLVSNPLRWSSYTTAQKNDISAYRQLLLDVPQQSGFPNTVDWPILSL
jgi:hypothetical protein